MQVSATYSKPAGRRKSATPARRFLLCFQERIQGLENAPIARFDWIGCYHRRSETSGDARTKPRAKRRLRSRASIELSHPFRLPFIRTKKRPNKQARSWPRGNYCADRKAGPGGQSQTCCVAERPRPCFLRPFVPAASFIAS